MVDIVTLADSRKCHRHLYGMFEDRKRVFIDRLRWDLPVISDRYEVDQFDDEYAVYLIACESNGEHLGSMRLLRSDRPHILGNLFPHLCENAVPANSATMEITRLCLCPALSAAERLQIRNRLISGMVNYALGQGIRTFTGVVTARFLSQVLLMGWKSEPLGPAQMVNGTTIGAFRIDIDAETPTLLSATGIYTPEEIDGFLSLECGAREQENAK